MFHGVRFKCTCGIAIGTERTRYRLLCIPPKSQKKRRKKINPLENTGLTILANRRVYPGVFRGAPVDPVSIRVIRARNVSTYCRRK